MSDWSEIDDGLMDPQWYAAGEPHEAFARLRREDPVHRVEGERYGRPFWVVTRYDESRQVIDDAMFYSNSRGMRPPRSPERLTADELYSMGSDVMVANLDPPYHTAFRQPMNKHFAVPSIKRMTERTTSIVRDLVEETAGQREVDFVEGFASEVPMRVVFDFLGVPRQDWSLLSRLLWEQFAPSDPKYAVEGQSAYDTWKAARIAIAAYSTELALERRRAPRDDFASVIAQARIEGVPLDDHEIAGWFNQIILGGIETTRNAMAVGLWLLFRHPDQLADLRSDPQLMPGAVDEILRWVTPVRARLRVVRADTELGGRPLRAGDWVVPYLSSANRDEAYFEEPLAFDIRRRPNRYLSFGEGVHKCLGRHLATLELSVALREFTAAFPELEVVVDDAPRWIVDHVVNGFTALTVRPGAPAAIPA